LPLSLKQNEFLAIIVSVKAANDNPKVNGRVIIKTDSKTTTEVVIPVFLAVVELPVTNPK